VSAPNEPSRQHQVSAPHPEAPWQAQRAAPVSVPPWSAGLRIDGSEVRTATRVAAVIGASGIPVGLAWLSLAPRRHFEVVDGGFQALEPQSEALIGADAWLTILTGVLGVLAAGLVWRLVKTRGVSIVVGLAVGMCLASVVAWQVGQWLGSGSSEAETTQIGAIVTPALQLRAIPVLVIGAFLATLTYLVVVCFAPSDNLYSRRPEPLSSDWRGPPTAPGEPVQPAAWPALSVPGATDAIVRPTEPSSGPRPGAPGDPQR